MRRVGKTRVELATRLTRDFGFQINPEDLWIQAPVYQIYQGACRWGAHCKTDSGIKIQICSWDTMKETVKAEKIGIVGGVVDGDETVEISVA